MLQYVCYSWHSIQHLKKINILPRCCFILLGFWNLVSVLLFYFYYFYYFYFYYYYYWLYILRLKGVWMDFMSLHRLVDRQIRVKTFLYYYFHFCGKRGSWCCFYYIYTSFVFSCLFAGWLLDFGFCYLLSFTFHGHWVNYPVIPHFEDCLLF